MYINGCNGDDRRVLIPDGSNDPEIQPPLDATLLVARDDWKADTFGAAWRPRTLMVDGRPKDFFEFILKKRSRVTLPYSGGAECFELETGLPRAQNADFEPDLDAPDTIAEIEVEAGKLTARSLADVPIVEWSIDDPNKRAEVTITAAVLNGRQPTGEVRTLTVRGEATVVFVHAADLYAEARPPLDATPQKDEWVRGWGGPPTSDSQPIPPYDYKGATLYAKIARGRRVDPQKFTYNRIANNPQPNIPDNHQPGVLKGVVNRDGWRYSDPVWCCR
ncbi:MAG TPA: hypothetical protein VF432_09475 [Thermoanaerobaculia bacterium]